MAVLTTGERQDAREKFIRAYFVALAKLADLSTEEVQTLINDLDTWLNANEAAANTAISAGVRTKASTPTKFAALAYVALKRAGIL